MGLVALFTSTIKLLGDITNLGLPVSAVRELSKAYEDTDRSVLERLVSVFRRWTLCTALVGMVLCVVLSSFISQLAFSSSDYTWHIVLLSPAVAFATLAAGETALLKATRKIHKLVKSSVYSLIASLVITVPLYYFMAYVASFQCLCLWHWLRLPSCSSILSVNIPGAFVVCSARAIDSCVLASPL